MLRILAFCDSTTEIRPNWRFFTMISTITFYYTQGLLLIITFYCTQWFLPILTFYYTQWLLTKIIFYYTQWNMYCVYCLTNGGPWKWNEGIQGDGHGGREHKRSNVFWGREEGSPGLRHRQVIQKAEKETKVKEQPNEERVKEICSRGSIICIIKTLIHAYSWAAFSRWLKRCWQQ